VLEEDAGMLGRSSGPAVADRPREINSRLRISAFLFIISPIVEDFYFTQQNICYVDGPLLVPEKDNKKAAGRQCLEFKLNVAHNSCLFSILHFL
jgi:hypothetical protein